MLWRQGVEGVARSEDMIEITGFDAVALARVRT